MHTNNDAEIYIIHILIHDFYNFYQYRFNHNSSLLVHQFYVINTRKIINENHFTFH